jgi:hypothetical protein
MQTRLTTPAKILATALLWIWQGAASAAPIQIDLSGKGTVSKTIELKDLDPPLPSDWSGYEFLVMEFKCSSPQRFELGLQMPDRVIHKNMHAFAGALVRAAIPLKYFYAQPSAGYDLASLYNKLAGSYWINIDGGGYEPLKHVGAIVFTVHNPVGNLTLDIRSIRLAAQSPGDAVLDPKVLVDEFGQWIPADWPGKAHSLDDLKSAWADEEASLDKDPVAGRDEYGGFTGTQAKATGFFRVERIEGHWWFVDPIGHYFYSTGVNGIGTFMPTKVAGRESIFAAMPPKDLSAIFAPRFPTTRQSLEGFASFYTWNLVRRYGTENWREKWATLTARRMANWGINTFYGPNPELQAAQPRQPYVLTVRNWQTGPAVLGMPDVYADDFEQRADSAAARTCEAHKDDPYLLGYFIGNEPPWPGQETLLAAQILAGPRTGIQRELQSWLKDHGDTAQSRRDFALHAFERYLTVIVAAMKKHDPNHLDLGIRFGGNPPDAVVSLARLFDVDSHNIYEAVPSPRRLQRYYELTGRPILIGEFHVGVPGRGMAAGLVQAASQEQRAAMYSAYVESAASSPNVIGTHWFQWIDEPVSGRFDGENYNIGVVDVTDRPYPELTAAMKKTQAKLLALRTAK